MLTSTSEDVPGKSVQDGCLQMCAQRLFKNASVWPVASAGTYIQNDFCNMFRVQSLLPLFFSELFLQLRYWLSAACSIDFRGVNREDGEWVDWYKVQVLQCLYAEKLSKAGQVTFLNKCSYHFGPQSEYLFLSPSSKLCQNWLHHWWVTLYAGAAVHRRCQHPPKVLNTNKTVEAA